jgi:hypothetical protein
MHAEWLYCLCLLRLHCTSADLSGGARLTSRSSLTAARTHEMRSALTAQLASHTADIEAAALEALALPLVAGAFGNSSSVNNSSNSCAGVTNDVFADVDSVLTDWQRDVQLLDVFDYKQPLQQPLETVAQPFDEQQELRQGCSEAIVEGTLAAVEHHFIVSLCNFTTLLLVQYSADTLSDIVDYPTDRICVEHAGIIYSKCPV